MAADDGADDGGELSDSERIGFRRLLDVLHAEHHFDFREYKTGSLRRRIRARMSHVRVEGFDAYVDYLRFRPQEAVALFNGILVNVTGFFRDPEAWEALRSDALPPIIAAARASGRLRVWSAGCSTGEETYSAAIMLADALGPLAPDVDVKIYATDIDEEALGTARQAAFRTDQLRDVPRDVLERHFTADGHLFRVRRELRRWCIFGHHNLAQDPPLPQISLLLCRNLLIYFKSALQERLLARFHYSLREGGVLFLGRSESLIARSRGFVPVSHKWRLFRRGGDVGTLADVATPRDDVVAEARSTSPAVAETPRVPSSGVLRSIPHPVILIGLDDFVREWNDAASALYEIGAEHAVGRQFRDLDISDRAEGLRARIEDVKRLVPSARLENMRLSRRSGEAVYVDFWISRVYDDGTRAAAILVAALDVTAMAHVREEIVRLGEQHATAAEELQATNEELETTNEELQATNEELETTNEELQSTNKELVTTVDELQAANLELGARSAEVRKLLVVVSSVAEALVALDHAFIVTTWNPAAERLFGVPAATAVGRDFFTLALGTPPHTARATLVSLAAGARDAADIRFDVPQRAGGTTPALLRFVRLGDVQGMLHGMLGLGRPS